MVGEWREEGLRSGVLIELGSEAERGLVSSFRSRFYSSQPPGCCGAYMVALSISGGIGSAGSEEERMARSSPLTALMGTAFGVSGGMPIDRVVGAHS